LIRPFISVDVTHPDLDSLLVLSAACASFAAVTKSVLGVDRWTISGAACAARWTISGAAYLIVLTRGSSSELYS
jgi:hypothetical protein